MVLLPCCPSCEAQAFIDPSTPGDRRRNEPFVQLSGGADLFDLCQRLPKTFLSVNRWRCVLVSFLSHRQ